MALTIHDYSGILSSSKCYGPTVAQLVSAVLQYFVLKSETYIMSSWFADVVNYLLDTLIESQLLGQLNQFREAHATENAISSCDSQYESFFFVFQFDVSV